MVSSKIIDRDRGFRAFMSKLRRKQRVAIGVKVGIQGPAAQDTGDRDGDITNVLLGTIHEFGAPSVGIPSRSFIRSTVDESASKYKALLLKAEQEAFKRKRDPVFFELGETALADIQNKIDENISPPLKPGTVAAKGDTLALVDTGEMRGAISWAPLKAGK